MQFVAHGFRETCTYKAGGTAKIAIPSKPIIQAMILPANVIGGVSALPDHQYIVQMPILQNVGRCHKFRAAQKDENSLIVLSFAIFFQFSIKLSRSPFHAYEHKPHSLASFCESMPRQANITVN